MVNLNQVIRYPHGQKKQKLHVSNHFTKVTWHIVGSCQFLVGRKDLDGGVYGTSLSPQLPPSPTWLVSTETMTSSTTHTKHYPDRAQVRSVCTLLHGTLFSIIFFRLFVFMSSYFTSFFPLILISTRLCIYPSWECIIVCFLN